MEPNWSPMLRLEPRADGCRLTLEGVTYGTGATLQEAGNDLLVRLFDLAAKVRRVGFTRAAGRPDPRVMRFLWEIGEITARGGDLRERVFGVPRQRTAAED